MLLSATIKYFACKRALVATGVLLLAICGVGAMHASPITYDLVLTDSSNSLYSGTGVITLNTAPSASGLSSYAPGQYSDLSFSIDGETFSQPPGTVSAVQFLNGQFYDITFAEQIGTSPDRFSLATTANYAFYYNDLLNVATGSITSSLAPAVTPEPSSLLLLGTGALACVGALRRRLRI